jgi:hypothetical protein
MFESNMGNKEMVEKFKEMWNKSGKYDDFFKYVIDYVLIVDKCGTELRCDDYSLEVDDKGELVATLLYKENYVAVIKLKNIVGIY